MAVKQPQVKRGRPCLYPWDKWLKRGRTVVKKGVDFECEVRSLELLARRQIKRRGLRDRASIQVRGLSVIIRVY